MAREIAVRRALKAVGLVALLLLVFFFVLAVLPTRLWRYVEAAWVLIFGWIQFVFRTGENIVVHWPAVGMAVICWVGVWVGLYYFLNRLRFVRGVSGWRMRNCGLASFAASALLLVVFLIGTSVCGIWQQSMWLARSDRPIVVNRRTHVGFQNLGETFGLYLRIELNNNGDQLEPAMRAAIKNFGDDYRGRRGALQRRLYFVPGERADMFAILQIEPGTNGKPPTYRLNDQESGRADLNPEEVLEYLESNRSQIRQVWPVYEARVDEQT